MRGFVSNHIAVFLVSGALLVGGAYFYQVQGEKEQARSFAAQTQCQAKYNKAFAVQLTERSRLSAASDNAKNDLLLGISKMVFAPPTTNAKVQAKRAQSFRDLFTKFDKAVAKVEKDRAATPLPIIPDC